MSESLENQGGDNKPEPSFSERLKQVRRLTEFQANFSWLPEVVFLETLVRYIEKNPQTTGNALRALEFLDKKVQQYQDQPEKAREQILNSDAMEHLKSVYRQIPESERRELEKGE